MDIQISKDSVKVIEGDSYCQAAIEQEMYFDEDDEEQFYDYMLINHLYVADGQRRQGLGRKLLRACVKAINENFDLALKLVALPDNEDIIDQDSLVEFYESEGFSPDDEQGGAGVVMVY